MTSSTSRQHPMASTKPIATGVIVHDVTSSAYSYQAILNAAHKVTWKVNDIIGNDRPLDFTKPFDRALNLSGLSKVEE